MNDIAPRDLIAVGLLLLSGCILGIGISWLFRGGLK